MAKKKAAPPAPEPKKKGRPPAQITPTEIEKLAQFHCTIVEMAGWFGVSRTTIQDRLRLPEYREAWLRGRAKIQLAVRRWQLKAAEEGNVEMLKFLGKNLLGQSDKVGIVLEDELPATAAEHSVVLIPWSPELEHQFSTIDAEFKDVSSANLIEGPKDGAKQVA